MDGEDRKCIRKEGSMQGGWGGMWETGSTCGRQEMHVGNRKCMWQLGRDCLWGQEVFPNQILGQSSIVE